MISPSTTTNLPTEQQRPIGCRVSVFALGSIGSDDRTIELDTGRAQQGERPQLKCHPISEGCDSSLLTPTTNISKATTGRNVSSGQDSGSGGVYSRASNDDSATIYAVRHSEQVPDSYTHERSHPRRQRRRLQRYDSEVIYSSTFSSNVLRA